MSVEPPLLLALDLTGTFAFAVNGALTAVRAAKLDIVGVIALGMITALGGGIIRDVLLDRLPPATFSDWRYLAVAAVGGLIAFVFGRGLRTTKRQPSSAARCNWRSTSTSPWSSRAWRTRTPWACYAPGAVVWLRAITSAAPCRPTASCRGSPISRQGSPAAGCGSPLPSPPGRRG